MNNENPQKELQAKIILTEEQKKELEKVFGKDLVDRIDSIDIEQLAGYLKANAHVN